MQSITLCRMHFSKYQAWSAALGWPKISHAQNAVRWLDLSMHTTCR